MSGDKVSSADNQQETFYYFTGFLAGEGSISIIKATNKKGGTGFYYTPDITISNADLSILKVINRVVSRNWGIITPIKGGYNLSIRGRRKVKSVLSFTKKYPPLFGKLIKNKLSVINQAILILDNKKNRNKRADDEVFNIEMLRDKLKEIKKTGVVEEKFLTPNPSRREIGYFLSGVVDAEGSMGFRRSKDRLQPYFCVAMKDEEIIDQFTKFFGLGSKYYRKSENIYHFETAKRSNVLSLVNFFLDDFPVRLLKNKRRLVKIKRILNDYTPRSQT